MRLYNKGFYTAAILFVLAEARMQRPAPQLDDIHLVIGDRLHKSPTHDPFAHTLRGVRVILGSILAAGRAAFLGPNAVRAARLRV